MNGTLAALLDNVACSTGFTPTFVRERAKYLQSVSMLRRTVGRKQPAAWPVDCVHVLLSLASDKASHAAGVVESFASLKRRDDCEPGERYARDALEKIVAQIWARGLDASGTTISLWRHPRYQIEIERADGSSVKFVPEADSAPSNLVGARSGLILPGHVIADVAWGLKNAA